MVKKLENQSSLSAVSSGEETHKKRSIKKNTKYESDYNLSKIRASSSSSAQSSSDGEVLPTVPKITPKVVNTTNRRNNGASDELNNLEIEPIHSFNKMAMAINRLEGNFIS